jgi:hypothetical protein
MLPGLNHQLLLVVVADHGMGLLTPALPTGTALQHFVLTMLLLVLPTFISTLQLGKDYQ